MKKIINPWTRREGYDCFGCCPNNPIGVHMNFFEDGDDIVSYWKPSQHYQGWINTMHGGILSTLIEHHIYGNAVTPALLRHMTRIPLLLHARHSCRNKWHVPRSTPRLESS